MVSRSRDESGFGLVELLIAMTVLAIGIFALVAGFSSGFGAINRASKTSTAGAIADQRMEAYRRGTYGALVVAPTPPPESVPGPDGRTYSLESTISYVCVLGTTPVAQPPPAEPTCPDSGGVKSKVAKLVKLSVRDGAEVLITESSTFHQSTG